MSQNQQEQSEAKLLEYVEGELDPASRSEIQKHLEAHPQHRRLLEELRSMRTWVQSLPREPAPAELAETFNSHLERSALLGTGTQVADHSMKLNRWPQFRAAAAVGGLAIGLGVIVYLALPRYNPYASIKPTIPADGLRQDHASATVPANGQTVDRDGSPTGMPIEQQLADGATSRHLGRPATQSSDKSSIAGGTPEEHQTGPYFATFGSTEPVADASPRTQPLDFQYADSAQPTTRMAEVARATYRWVNAADGSRLANAGTGLGDSAAAGQATAINGVVSPIAQAARPKQIVMVVLCDNTETARGQINNYLAANRISTMPRGEWLSEYRSEGVSRSGESRLDALSPSQPTAAPSPPGMAPTAAVAMPSAPSASVASAAPAAPTVRFPAATRPATNRTLAIADAVHGDSAPSLARRTVAGRDTAPAGPATVPAAPPGLRVASAMAGAAPTRFARPAQTPDSGATTNPSVALALEKAAQTRDDDQLSIEAGSKAPEINAVEISKSGDKKSIFIARGMTARQAVDLETSLRQPSAGQWAMVYAQPEKELSTLQALTKDKPQGARKAADVVTEAPVSAPQRALLDTTLHREAAEPSAPSGATDRVAQTLGIGSSSTRPSDPARPVPAPAPGLLASPSAAAAAQAVAEHALREREALALSASKRGSAAPLDARAEEQVIRGRDATLRTLAKAVTQPATAPAEGLLPSTQSATPETDDADRPIDVVIVLQQARSAPTTSPSATTLPTTAK